MPPHSSYLRLDVRGGLNNQRECIVNGIVAAHELGLHLVLPSAHPVGQGNEKYDPHDAKFEGIYADRSQWPALRPRRTTSPHLRLSRPCPRRLC